MGRRGAVVCALALAAVLSACAARPTPYQPRDGGFGYSQTQIDSKTWRVEFAGNLDTSRETVENYLLYRAAEIMLFGGHDDFVVLEREVERIRDYREVGPYPYHAGAWHRHRHHGFHHLYGRSRVFAYDSYRAIATVRVYAGGAPPAGLRVYAAREVIAQLGPSVRLPE